MTRFKININAEPLFDRNIAILNIRTGELYPPKTDPHHWDGTLRTFELEPGPHGVHIYTGHSEVKFRVNDTGTVTPIDPFGVCMEVLGDSKNTLLVKGFEVTLDARYLAMDNARGVLLGTSSDSSGWIVHKTTRLLPATYQVEQGSATVSQFVFDLNLKGLFDYKPSYDLSQGGFLGGLGTSTLVLRGYPLLVDATKVGEHVTFLNMKIPQGAHNGVMFANLLPLKVAFPIEFKGENAEPESQLPSVQVSLQGEVRAFAGHVYKLTKDSFHGLTRLTIEKK